MRVSLFMLILAFAILTFFGAVLVVRAFLRRYDRRARRFGYTSRSEFLRAAPKSDDEKQDAVSEVLKGLMFCLVGFLFPPLLLVGLVPLFFGLRKVLYSSMGLGLVDDAEQPGA